MISANVQSWRLKTPFTVSRRSVDGFDAVLVELSQDNIVGRAEVTGIYYAGETVEKIKIQINKVASNHSLKNLTHDLIESLALSSGAKCGLDCALWDLLIKQQRISLLDVLKIKETKPLVTSYTISKGSLAQMRTQTQEHDQFKILKVKVGGDNDLETDLARIEAVHDASKGKPLIVDPNSSWTADDVILSSERLNSLNVIMLEQPFAPGAENDFTCADHPFMVCADEAVNTVEDISKIRDSYNCINIKLEKCGGLTPGLCVA